MPPCAPVQRWVTKENSGRLPQAQNLRAHVGAQIFDGGSHAFFRSLVARQSVPILCPHRAQLFGALVDRQRHQRSHVAQVQHFFPAFDGMTGLRVYFIMRKIDHALQRHGGAQNFERCLALGAIDL